MYFQVYNVWLALSHLIEATEFGRFDSGAVYLSYIRATDLFLADLKCKCLD